MPEFPPPSEGHSDAILTSVGSEVVPEQEVRDMELILDLCESPFLSNSCPLEVNGQETQQVDSSWSHDGDMQGFGQLERRWVLWHEFMKEHDQLDTWLRLAEPAVSSSHPDNVTYVTAKEELRKIERLRCEAGSRLVQLDSLTRRNRTLTRLFHGAMQARLLAAARDCGQRWDDVNAKLEYITTRPKLFVSEWEEFEAEREELALWLADLDGRLTQVDYLSGHTCEKLRKLQSFQQSVCVNSDRVNVLLQRGEALIQRCNPTDARHVESDLLKMLRRCSLVYNNIARTHSRLLSMRLVFEDDLILSQATDSGCPSETILEEEGALDKANTDIPSIPNYPKDFSQSSHPTQAFSPLQLPLLTSTQSSPTHEHLGLEWDPSVDIGRSVSRDNADSFFFSASAGLPHHRNGVKRRSYLSSLCSESDIRNDIINHEADLRLDRWLEHNHPSVLSPIENKGGGTRPNGVEWATSTPDAEEGGPVSFDDGRVRAWLRVQSPAPSERRTSRSKSVQTDGQVECNMDGRHMDAPNKLRPHLNTHHTSPDPSHSPSHDLKAAPDWMKHQYRSDLQAGEEQPCCEGAERLLSEQSVTPNSRAPSSRFHPALLCLLLAVALALLACLIWFFLEPPSSFHLALKYVNGPPPT
ncbi:hypothetical protein CgunFtcFv8_010939 [Champsocephalus gunnari]|uniref:Uncharacterized protein n=2 Tax=Champsocephalus TaxID=52236 RepID=A0AAN8DX08_CHAGU|nr:hypothetical protein CgunFtcFv8_010939 [Champsocephalus gunnari]